MSAEDLNLSGVKTLDQALSRTRNGVAAVELAKRMGIWTESAHQHPKVRPPFPAQMSDLALSQLSDLYAQWTGEFGRVVELCGVVAGQDALLKIQLKTCVASARARILRGRPADAKPLSAQNLSDQSEEDPAVKDLLEQTGLIAVLKAHTDAAREATAQYLVTISREIAFRDAQMKARVY